MREVRRQANEKLDFVPYMSSTSDKMQRLRRYGVETIEIIEYLFIYKMC